MLIGIDASRAVSVSPTGTETYARELIRALLALDRDNSYRLYTRERIPRDFFAGITNYELRITNHESRPFDSAQGKITNYEFRVIPFPRLWTHLRLSFEMLTRPPDVLFVPAHVLPLIHPRRSVVTIHDLGHLHFPAAYPLTQRLYHTWSTRWNARAASHIFADSEATRDDLSRFFRVPPEKISVVYPAYDARVYRPVRDMARIAETKARLRIDGDYILAIGTIHPRKNYARLIEAFGRLEIGPFDGVYPEPFGFAQGKLRRRAQGKDWRLVIVGKRGWLYDSIFTRVQQLNLQSLISFLDYVPAEELPALISGARLLAFPSLHEGFGLPVLEAQACGTPVVCSMTSSFPEVAGDGALFVDPLDVDAIAGAMQRLLTDDALRAKLIANGFRNVQRFSWEQSARAVLEVLAR